MTFLKRQSKPTLHYKIDDFTDPWKKPATILLQHGYGRSGRFWYSWVPYLSRFFRVVRLDLRGFGLSPVDFDPYTGITLANHADDVVALLDALEIESMHYCGESFGGILGMVLAAQHPAQLAPPAPGHRHPAARGSPSEPASPCPSSRPRHTTPLSPTPAGGRPNQPAEPSRA